MFSELQIDNSECEIFQTSSMIVFDNNINLELVLMDPNNNSYKKVIVKEDILLFVDVDFSS